LRLNPGLDKPWAEAKSPRHTKTSATHVTALAEVRHAITTFCKHSRRQSRLVHGFSGLREMFAKF
jgi:hypothetical protein